MLRHHDGVRHGKSPAARAHARLELIRRYDDRLRDDPVARAFQWQRVASYASRSGRRLLATRARLTAAWARRAARSPRYTPAPGWSAKP